MELHHAALQLLAAKEEMQRIKVSISQIIYEIKTLQISFNQQLEKYKNKYAEYNLQLADARQELIEVTSAASADVNAPVHGQLDYSYVIAGKAVKKGDAIAIIIPDGAQPLIILDIPSAAVGDISTGQTVKIRVSSFPWRRYGKLNGIVKSISPTAVHTPKGMVFRVTAELQYNPNFRLRDGMEVTANIPTVNKRIYHWLFNFITIKWKN